MIVVAIKHRPEISTQAFYSILPSQGVFKQGTDPTLYVEYSEINRDMADLLVVNLNLIEGVHAQIDPIKSGMPR